MIKTKICTALLIILGFIPLVYAQPSHTPESQRCGDEEMRNIGKLLSFDDLAYRNEQGKGLVLMAACKIWPYDESITISAFLEDLPNDAHNPVLYIAMVDNKKNQLLAQYRDALGNSFAPDIDADNDNLRIDTARYDIAPGIRAFGVDVIKGSQDDPYCGAETIGPTRNLYIKRDNEIRFLFYEGVTMSYRTRVKGSVKCKYGKPTTKKGVVFEDIKLTISPSKKTTDGFADLIITGESTYSDGTPSPRKPYHLEMHYTDNYYQNKDLGTYGIGPETNLDDLLREWQNDSESAEH